MTGTDVVITTADAAELQADPVQYMSVVLHRAKGWLAEAQSLDAVRETKAIAVGYESVIREKELAFDAQLSATEIVRRCERRIGELVRQGQQEGTFFRRGQTEYRPGHHLPDTGDGGPTPRRVAEIFTAGGQEHADINKLGDAPAEQFEQAIAQAREEGNLSRANVVRKVKGTAPSRSNGAAANGGASRPAVVTRIAEQAEAMAMAIGALNLTKSCERMPDDERQAALASCKAGLRALNTMARALAASERSSDE